MDVRAQNHLKRLVDEVPDTTSKALLANLTRLALLTLQELSNIDESIDDKVVRYRSDLASALAELIPEIRTGPLRRLRAFISFLVSQDLLDQKERPEFARDEPSGMSDLDFDLDDLNFDSFSESPSEGSSITAPLAEVDELDIDAAFDSISEPHEASSREKLDEMRQEVRMLGHALREQFESTESLILESYEAGQYDVTLREIDMGRESLTEGLFAIVSTVFDIFLGGCERTELLPGYTDALQRSLLIRRGLAGVTAEVRQKNAIVQDDRQDEDRRRMAIAAITIVLSRFQRSEGYTVMRWLDRLEISGLHAEIAEAPFAEAVISCEGLTRYLESLSVVNQREVLQQHDQQLIDGIHQSLDAARSLLEVSIAGAMPLAQEAHAAAEELFGRNALFDEQLRRWRVEPPVFSTREGLVQFIEEFEEVL